MKYRYLLIGLMSVMAFSCTESEMVDLEGPDRHSPSGDVFYVSIGEQPDAETKVYADDSLRVLWNHGDRISVFNKKTYNREYSFQGEDGTNAGKISPEGEDGEGNPLGLVYAVYPYQDSTSVSSDGIISFTLPEIQTYLENSFGIGANTMVSAMDGNKLKFKNVGGYLALKLYGNNVSVSSVIVRGNNNEFLAGLSEIEMTEGGPEISLDAESASKQVRLYCNDPVELGSSSNAEECTVFWFVLPPVEFSQGFNITVTTPDGGVFKKSTSKPTSIVRSRITRFAPLEVIPTASGNDIKINEISSNAGGYGVEGGVTKSDDSIYYNKADYDSDTRTYTITLPTVTDFSELKLNYSLTAGDILIVDGKEVASGVPIDASSEKPATDKMKPSSKPVSLTVCRGDAEKRFTLVARNTGLPVVKITTVGFTQADLDAKRKYKSGNTIIDEREWRPTETELDEKTAAATIVIEYPNGSVDTDVATQIKGRGNATWKYDKRPYALKLGKKSSPLGLGHKGNGKHKRWILLANWKDRTLLRNEAAFWLSRQTDLDFTVNGTFVELEFNGIHRGNYYLCEQIKVDNTRVAIDDWDPKEDSLATVVGGFMMEIDNNYDEEFKFLSDGFSLKYMFKDPDEDISTEAFNYMKNFVKTMETQIKNASKSDTYMNYFDIESAIWFMFVNELTGNGDFFNTDGGSNSEWYGPHSTYLYKDKDVLDENGNVVESKKMFMGPVWDFDYLTFVPNRSSSWVGVNKSGYYYYYLRNNKAFCDMVRELWESYREKIDTEFATHIDDLADLIRTSEVFNTTMWGYSNTSQDQGQNGDNTLGFQAAVDRMKEAFSTKYTYMNTNLYNKTFLQK